MRYHTMPLIGFAVFLECKRFHLQDKPEFFQLGTTYSCFVPDMRATKVNALEYYKTVYRKYFLRFNNQEIGKYTFVLEPSGSIFKDTVKGEITRDSHHVGGGSYHLDRYNRDLKESYVKFFVDYLQGSFSGSYYNWHLEQGEFSGRVQDQVVGMTIRGRHYRSEKFRHSAESARDTVWTAAVSFSSIKADSSFANW